jgi:glycine cleavage system H protein
LHTLQEFLTLTKGTEYLVGVAFLAFFVIFWRVLNAPPRVRAKVPDKLLAFAPASLRLPENVFLTDGHMWLRPNEDGTLDVGLDDLMARALGRVDAIVPPVSSAVRRGDTAFTLRSGRRELSFHMPFDGKVQAVNPKVLDVPEAIRGSAYHEGWVLKIKPASMAAALRPMKIAEDAKTWLRREAERLRDFLVTSFGSTLQPSHVALQDGGEIMERVLDQLDDKGWERFQKEFLEFSPKESPE